MAGLRDPAVSKYVHISSKLDNIVGTRSNFDVTLTDQAIFQRVKGVQLLNASFVPTYYNVSPGNNVLRWREQNRWSIRSDPAVMGNWPLLVSYRSSGLNFAGTINVPVTEQPLQQQQYYAFTFTSRIQAAIDLVVEGWTFRCDITEWYSSAHQYNMTLDNPGGEDDGILSIIPNQDLTNDQLHATQNMLGLALDPSLLPAGRVTGDYGWAVRSHTVSPAFTRTAHIQSYYGTSLQETAIYTATVNPGNYTIDDLLTALNAAAIVTEYHPDGAFDPAGIHVYYADNHFPPTIWVEANPPSMDDGDSHKAGLRILQTGLSDLLGYETYRDDFPQDIATRGFAIRDIADHDTNLQGPLRVNLHVRPINVGQGLFPREQPLRTAAWAGIPLLGSGVPHFYDFTHAGDAAYFVGFLEPLACQSLNISLRFMNGDEVELNPEGLELSLKFIYEA